MTDTEKTLLQQIRDKEHEFARQIDTTRSEADVMIAAARTDAEDLLCTAEKAGKTSAEQVYWNEKGRIESEIETLKKAAEQEREGASRKEEHNLPKAADRIFSYVTMG
ncbi:MAG: V-type ATPase subunit subunit G family protein [Methanoregula sp.]